MKPQKNLTHSNFGLKIHQRIVNFVKINWIWSTKTGKKIRMSSKCIRIWAKTMLKNDDFSQNIQKFEHKNMQEKTTDRHKNESNFAPKLS